jgi:hypothetical protein
MSNTTTTAPGDDREAAAILAKFDKAILGVSTLPATQQIVYKQATYTPVTFVPVLQAGAAPLRAVVTARSALTTALNNRHETFEDSVALINAFFTMLPQILPPGTDVTQFGAEPHKPREEPTAEQKVVSNQKREATRAARHIMGKKQRKAIQAPAAAAPATPAPAAGTAASTAVKTGP